MIKKVILKRVKGADSEPITLEVDQIQEVKPGSYSGRSIVVLPAGNRVEVLGTVEQVNQLIDDAI